MAVRAGIVALMVASACGAPDATSKGPTLAPVDATVDVPDRFPDPGIDAMPLDAGPVDARPIDAGSVDAHPVDAGTVDARLVDASTVDARPIDAGAVDARPIDAGPSDGAPPDGAPPDGAPPDAAPIDAGGTDPLVAICGAVPVTFDDWEDCYQR